MSDEEKLFDLSDKYTNISFRRFIKLINEFKDQGIFELGMELDFDMGFSGDPAVIFKGAEDRPMMNLELQKQLMRNFANYDDEFEFREAHESYSGKKRPAYLLMNKITG